MKLTKTQRAVLVGSVLGDAYIQKTGEKNARLRFEHGEKQKAYIEWKAGMFPRLFQGRPKYLERIHPKTKQTYKYWRHQSNTTSEFGAWQRLFYEGGKKVIPSGLPDILTEPLSVAVWYMDDGYYHAPDRNCYVYLGRVSEGEARIAQTALQKNFDLYPKIYNKGRKGFALFFNVAETLKLHRIIKRFILPCMHYKLHQKFLTP